MPRLYYLEVKMPRKKIIRPFTMEEHAANLAKKHIRQVAFRKSEQIVEVEWSMDGVLGLDDGYFARFVNKRAKIPARYLDSAERSGCRLVRNET
jgi:hypothetical protein